MGIKYQETFVVKNHEVDRYKRMTLATLSRLCLSVSTNHTHRLYQDRLDLMAQQGLTWFILQHDLQIKRMPVLFDEIVVETEALSYNRFFTLRAFRVFSQGELIIETLMKFGVVDLEKRQMVRILPEYVAVFGAENQGRLPKMTKIPKIQANDTGKVFRADYNHIDYNQHVNNAVYLDWLLSGLDEAFLATHVPTHVALAYDKEMRINQELTHYYQGQLEPLDSATNGKAVYTTTHSMVMGDESIARAVVEWHEERG